jgi:hypothetical protein
MDWVKIIMSIGIAMQIVGTILIIMGVTMR